MTYTVWMSGSTATPRGYVPTATVAVTVCAFPSITHSVASLS